MHTPAQVTLLMGAAVAQVVALAGVVLWVETHDLRARMRSWLRVKVHGAP